MASRKTIRRWVFMPFRYACLPIYGVDWLLTDSDFKPYLEWAWKGELYNGTWY